MTPETLCEVLDTLKISNADAARELGCHITTLLMYCNGRRFRSHGGKEIKELPGWLERNVERLIKDRSGTAGSTPWGCG